MKKFLEIFSIMIIVVWAIIVVGMFIGGFLFSLT